MLVDQCSYLQYEPLLNKYPDAAMGSMDADQCILSLKRWNYVGGVVDVLCCFTGWSVLLIVGLAVVIGLCILLAGLIIAKR